MLVASRRVGCVRCKRALRAENLLLPLKKRLLAMKSEMCMNSASVFLYLIAAVLLLALAISSSSFE